MTQRTAMTVVATLCVLGCSTESISLKKTSEIEVQMHATANGNGNTGVRVSFYDPKKLLTFLQLTADDAVSATMGSQTRTLSETSLFGAVSYSANFNGDTGDVHVKLTRKTDSGAPDSYVTMPGPFVLTPLTKTLYSRAEAIGLTWTDPSSDTMGLDVDASCLNAYHLDVGTGASAATIPASALTKQANTSSTTFPDECDGTITLTRTRSGTIDHAFYSGSIAGEQTRYVTFHTKP
jgi:hypothetical protein